MRGQGLLLAVLMLEGSVGIALAVGAGAGVPAAGGGLVPLLRRTEGGALGAAAGSYGRIGGAGSAGLLLSRLGGVGPSEMWWGDGGRGAGEAEGLLRLRGGYKGTSSMGKKGTGGKSHPSYKYNLSMPRVSKHGSRKYKRYTLHKKPERTGKHKHLRAVNQRFKHGFRCRNPYEGPGSHDTKA